ncbi:MAG: hypothetical protein HYZ37_10640 [Candidatus Solibacter usitatus]|nr:hypothetical protein [Candidatus Solibacter usitatus]
MFKAILVLAFALAQSAQAQTQISLRDQGRNVDFSGASNVKPVPVLTSIPATCAVGELIFLSNAAAGQNLYACTSANTWSAPAGGTFDLGLNLARASATVLTLGSGCSVSAPCRVRFGAIGYQFTAPINISLNSGTGTAFIYLNSQGVLSVASNPLGALSLTCPSGCQVDTTVTGFPVDSIPLWTWSSTANAWDVTGGTDRRSALSAGRQILPSTNVTVTETASSVTIGLASPFRITTSGAKPNCSIALRGALWFTSSGTGVADHFEICAKNSSDQYLWNMVF